MTHEQIIAELVRIWHSPHLDLSLKAGLGEVIEALKENNQSDSLVRDDAENCKESESKLDLISRQDAIELIRKNVSKAETESSLWFNLGLGVAEKVVESLPSAEDVEGCDGCRYNTRIPQEQCLRCGRYWRDSYASKGGDTE